MVKMVNLLGREPGSEPAPATLVAELTPERLALLEARIGDVRRWWAARTPRRSVADLLRTPVLEPDLEDDPTLAALEQAIESLSAKRAARLAGIPAGAATGEGRLLLCELGIAIGSGEAEARSRGYLDVDDRPPWDTWLLGFGRARATRPDEPIVCLVAWVPDELVDLVDEGVRASPARCLHWVGL